MLERTRCPYPQLEALLPIIGDGGGVLLPQSCEFVSPATIDLDWGRRWLIVIYDVVDAVSVGPTGFDCTKLTELMSHATQVGVCCPVMVERIFDGYFDDYWSACPEFVSTRALFVVSMSSHHADWVVEAKNLYRFPILDARADRDPTTISVSKHLGRLQ